MTREEWEMEQHKKILAMTDEEYKAWWEKAKKECLEYLNRKK